MSVTYSLDTGPYEIIVEALSKAAESDPLEILIREEEERANWAHNPRAIGSFDRSNPND